MIEIMKGIPVVHDKAFVTTNEICTTALCHIHGFDEPIRIEVHGIKDRRTNQYREFEVKVDAPPAMRARFQKLNPEAGRIIVPKGD